MSDHPPMAGEIEGGFNSSTAPLLTRLFWARLFSTLSPVSGNVALRDGTTVFTTWSSLRSLLRSTSTTPIGSFPGSLSMLLVYWSEGLLTRTVLRDFAAVSGEIDDFFAWDTKQLPWLDSRTSIASSCVTWHRQWQWVPGLQVQVQRLRDHGRHENAPGR